MCSCVRDCAVCEVGRSFVRLSVVLEWREADCWIPSDWRRENREPDSSSGSRCQTEIHPKSLLRVKMAAAQRHFYFCFLEWVYNFNDALLLSVKRPSQEKKLILQIHFYLVLHAKAHCTWILRGTPMTSSYLLLFFVLCVLQYCTRS